MRPVVTWTIATTAAATAVLAALGASLTPAGAAPGADPGLDAAVVAPRILSPSDGAVLDEPVRSVTVDFTGVEPGLWLVNNVTNVRGQCGNLACIGDTFVRVEAGGGVRQVELDAPLDDAGAYRLYVQDDRTSPTPGASDESSFTLTSDATYAGVTQESATFSPDGDGVADRTVLRFSTPGGAGRPVARVQLPPTSGSIADAAVTGNAYDGWTVTWDGRFHGGDTAFADDYLIAVDTPDARGVTSRLEREVTVGATPVTGTTRVSGAEPTVTVAGGSCVARSGVPDGRSTLRCRRGSGTAEAQYRLRIPQGASVTGFRVKAVTASAEGARVTRRLQWVGQRQAAVRVRVAGPASTVIEQVSVRWRLPARR